MSRRRRGWLTEALPGALSAREIDLLAVYNAERSRGLVHTPEWDRKMAALQADYDRWMAAR